MLPALPPWVELVGLARREVEATLRSLPAELEGLARSIPVLYEKVPGERHGPGVEPDTLGLFMGPSLAEAGECHGQVSSHIVLFLHNLWDMTDGEPAEFVKEVQITLLHELGHYLGLDEEDLEWRGLD
jgi:predicted Zn-dependent protease with MMP-like domain